MDDMLFSRTYTLAALAAFLAATAVDTREGADAAMPDPQLQVQRSHEAPADTSAQDGYLPALFEEAARAAPIEPLPPQF